MLTVGWEMRKAARASQPKHKAVKSRSPDRRLEQALDEGLKETASDAVSVTEPTVPGQPMSARARRKRA
jgi:hypothetical protein